MPTTIISSFISESGKQLMKQPLPYLVKIGAKQDQGFIGYFSKPICCSYNKRIKLTDVIRATFLSNLFNDLIFTFMSCSFG